MYGIILIEIGILCLGGCYPLTGPNLQVDIYFFTG